MSLFLTSQLISLKWHFYFTLQKMALTFKLSLLGAKNISHLEPMSQYTDTVIAIIQSL